MSKFLVQAVTRPGFNTVSRGGRAWPSAAATEVEVLDEDECPRIPVEGRPGQTQLDPVRIGRKAWALVMADGRLSKTPVGVVDATAAWQTAAGLRDRVDTLEAQVAEHLETIAQRDRSIAALTARVTELEGSATGKPVEGDDPEDLPTPGSGTTKPRRR
jgi:uncharacterized coiled-coil protein SlyX